jgi:hypothetical protein
VPEFKAPGAGLEQQRREHEEVLAAHERDLDVPSCAQDPLEMTRGRHAAESAAQYDDSHVAPDWAADHSALKCAATFTHLK